MNGHWGVYDDLNGDVDLYSTQEEALTAANGILDTECEDEISPEYLSGGVKVFCVTHESAALATRTPEEQEAVGPTSGGYDFYVDMGIVPVNNDLFDAARELLRLRSIKGTPEYCEKKEAAWAALEKAVKGDRNDE